MRPIKSIHFEMDDGESVSIFLSDAMCYVDESNPENLLQVPVFAGDRTGVLHVTEQEARTVSNNMLVKEATQWALKTRKVP